MARNKYDVDEQLESAFQMVHLKRSLLYVKRYGRRMLLAFLLSIVASVVSLFGPSLTQMAIDVALPNKDVRLLVLLSSLLAGTIVISVLLSMARGLIIAAVGQHIIRDIRRDLFVHLQELPFSYYDSRPHGKILVRVVHYVNNVADMLSNGLISIVIELLNVVFIVIFMLRTDARLALIIMAGLPVVTLVIFLLKPAQRKAWQQISNKNSNLTAYTAENIDGVRVTQMFDRQPENMNIYRKLVGMTRKAWMKGTRISYGVGFSTELMAQIVLALVYIAGILWFDPTISPGVLLAMGAYASRFWQPIVNLANLYNNVINSISYLERIFETIDEPVTVSDAPDATPLPPMIGEVSFDKVSFAYEPPTMILNEVSFTVRPGQSVALVGPTGAGKSTIINLISRFYNVTDGIVLIDGQDISAVTLQSLRSQLGIMMQDSFIFSGTVADNIRYGRLDATEEEIRAAAIAVRADEFITELSNGYETELSERGGSLSAGQKQLISFARTMLSDPRVLILDEATSSIDAKTEQLLQTGIAELLRGRTSFIVAHRLSTIQSCDVIMFIDGGNIVERGSHEELMERQDRYYELYMAGTAQG